MINNKYIGYIVEGKWGKHKYQILQFLGEGGIGRVYKVKDLDTNEFYALKLSDDLHSITKEYEILKKFQYMELFPRIREIDDCFLDVLKMYYIAMEYIDGNNLKVYREKKPMKVQDVIGLAAIIGRTFRILHNNHLVFGDLKLENLMIDKNKKILRIIDFGGVTPMGYGIKEFTPLYDRASWKTGTRRADEKYDLFSLNMFIVTLLLNRNISVEGNSVDNLMKQLETVDISPCLIHLIHMGLRQKILTFDEYLYQLEEIINNNEYMPKFYKENDINRIINFVFAGSILLLAGVLTFAGKSMLY